MIPRKYHALLHRALFDDLCERSPTWARFREADPEFTEQLFDEGMKTVAKTIKRLREPPDDRS